MTHEEHQLRHRELRLVPRELLDVGAARLRERSIREWLAWAAAQPDCRELHAALTELVDDWIAHYLERPEAADRDRDAYAARLCERPLRDLMAWAEAQAINPTPLLEDLHVERTAAAHEPCDADCGYRFRNGHERCRHLRTPEESLRTLNGTPR